MSHKNNNYTKAHYMLQMRPAFNKSALFSDATENYRQPMEPNPGDMVTLKLRTKKNNVDTVYLVYGDRKEAMELCESTRGFDYYAATIPVGEEKIYYYFEIWSGFIRCFYNNRGVSMEEQKQFSFGIVPGFHTPVWSKGAVIYQIFVDRFCNGDQTNDVQTHEYHYINGHTTKVDDWFKPPALMSVGEFYGGDLQGIIDKLDYLQDLGVEVLYLNPIFVSPSNHKYDIQDYDYVDPHYGIIVSDGGELLADYDNDNRHATKYMKRVTDKENLEASNQLFIQLVKELHSRGMKVILDGVFNHCGSFNKWLDRECIYEACEQSYEPGAFVSADSPYRSFFKFNDEGQWPYNTTYDGWWAHDTLPKLNYENSDKLYQYILDVAKKWVSPPYNADGWRLDVAADLGHSNEFNHKFWKDFRKVVKKANPQAIILAEHYGDSRGWLLGDEWDTVMNYDAFMEPVTWFLTGMEKHSDEFRGDLLGNSWAFEGAMKTHMASFYEQSLQVAMNELSNHDHSRFLTRTNHKVGRVAQLGYDAASECVDKAVFREAVVIQMTWPGAPTIYYGDEAGVCGFTDPDNRRTYPWGQEDQEMIQFHKDVIRMHKRYSVLTSGSLKFLTIEQDSFSYGRFSMEEQVIVAVNNSDQMKGAAIPVWETGISRTEQIQLERVLLSYGDYYTTEKRVLVAEGGILYLQMPAKCALVLYHKSDS